MKRSSEIRLHYGSLWTAAIDTPRETTAYIRADVQGYWDCKRRAGLFARDQVVKDLDYYWVQVSRNKAPSGF
jgi:hypothetical protein